MNNEKKGEDEKRRFKEVNFEFKYLETSLIGKEFKGTIGIIRRNKGSVLKSKKYNRYRRLKLRVNEGLNIFIYFLEFSQIYIKY